MPGSTDDTHLSAGTAAQSASSSSVTAVGSSNLTDRTGGNQITASGSGTSRTMTAPAPCVDALATRLVSSLDFQEGKLDYASGPSEDNELGQSVQHTASIANTSTSISISGGGTGISGHIEDSAVPIPELKRHPDLWFDDGSIILKAETTLFRVHISQLARHSVTFRDMFSIPQPAAAPSRTSARGSGPSSTSRAMSPTSSSSCSPRSYGSAATSSSAGPRADAVVSRGIGADVDGDDGFGAGRIDGCPVLEMHDSAEDLGHLLTALYDGPTFGNNDREDFRAVSGILRLSNKYVVEGLRAKALAHLSTAWPCTLRAWDMREDLARVHELQTGMHPGTRYPSPALVINLAREVDAPTLLPSAFYDLSRYQFTQILLPSSESSSFPEDASNPLFCPPDSCTTSSSLSLSDTHRLALGKEASQHAITALIQAMGQSQHIRQASSPLQAHHRRNVSASLGAGSSTGSGSTSSSPSFSHPSFAPLHASCSSGLGGGGGAYGQGHYHHHHTNHHGHSGQYSHQAVCVSAAACRKDFSELVDLATQHYLFDRERGACDPLYVAEELGQLKSAEFSECVACARSLECWAARERERMWKMIASWFRLDTGVSVVSAAGAVGEAM